MGGIMDCMFSSLIQECDDQIIVHYEKFGSDFFFFFSGKGVGCTLKQTRKLLLECQKGVNVSLLQTRRVQMLYKALALVTFWS